MSTITTTQQQAIAKLLDQMFLPKGMGTKESACSITAINLALTGKLTDNIPACMSAVIGRWIIGVQDAMPSEMRNSAEWKRLLPLAAGTGRKHEKERMDIVVDWMWSAVLPTLQPVADCHGFGNEWRAMLCEKTSAAACAALSTANAAYVAADAAYAVAQAANAAYAAVTAAAIAAYATAADAAAEAVADATSPEAWQQFNPCGLLERLVELEGQGDG